MIVVKLQLFFVGGDGWAEGLAIALTVHHWPDTLWEASLYVDAAARSGGGEGEGGRVWPHLQTVFWTGTFVLACFRPTLKTMGLLKVNFPWHTFTHEGRMRESGLVLHLITCYQRRVVNMWRQLAGGALARYLSVGPGNNALIIILSCCQHCWTQSCNLTMSLKLNCISAGVRRRFWLGQTSTKRNKMKVLGTYSVLSEEQNSHNGVISCFLNCSAPPLVEYRALWNLQFLTYLIPAIFPFQKRGRTFELWLFFSLKRAKM